MKNPMQLSAAAAAILAASLIFTEPKRVSRTREPDGMTRLVDYASSTVKSRTNLFEPKPSEEDHIRIEKAEAKRQRKAAKRLGKKGGE